MILLPPISGRSAFISPFLFNALIPCIPFSRLAGEGDDDIHFTYYKNLFVLFMKQSDHPIFPPLPALGRGVPSLARRGEGA